MRRVIAASAIALLLGGTAVATPSAAATTEPGSIGASGTISYPVENTSFPVTDLVFGTASESGDFKEEGPKITLAGEVLFNPNKDTLSTTADTELKRLVQEIQARNAREITVTGHTDNVQGSAHNQKLSERRATAIGKTLRKALGEDVKVTTAGKGQDQPIADNESDEGRKLNRRVEITVVK